MWCFIVRAQANTMKTYNKTISSPRLVIEYDEHAENPRTFDGGNIGYFFTKEGRHISPDGTKHSLYHAMIETSEEAKDTAHHIELMHAKGREMFKEAKANGLENAEEYHIITDEIHPVYRYEHGNVAYRRGTAAGFDYSNCGFYIVTAAGISGKAWTSEEIAKQIDRELEEYTAWANGEVYRFTLYDENGEEVDSCGGFYDIEDIREHLPEEWKDERLEEYQAGRLAE